MLFVGWWLLCGAMYGLCVLFVRCVSFVACCLSLDVCCLLVVVRSLLYVVVCCALC